MEAQSLTSSTRWTISALPSPRATKTTSFAALSTGSVKVMRSGGGFGESEMGTTQPCSNQTECEGSCHFLADGRLAGITPTSLCP